MVKFVSIYAYPIQNDSVLKLHDRSNLTGSFMDRVDLYK